MLILKNYHSQKIQIIALSDIKYDKTNTQHEAELMKLWAILKPEKELKSRVSNEWQEIGF